MPTGGSKMKEGGRVLCSLKDFIQSIKRAQEVYIGVTIIEGQPEIWVLMRNKTKLINLIREHCRDNNDLSFSFQAFSHDYGRKLYIGGVLVT
jgi:hypothetical protein